LIAGVERRVEHDDGAIEDELWNWLDPLEAALCQGRCVICIALWQSIAPVALLPFHLSLALPDVLRGLPLNTEFGIVPFGRRTRSLVQEFRYEVGAAHLRRREARYARYNEERAHPKDFLHADWESRLDQHPEIARKSLAGTSFLAVEAVGGGDGVASSASRKVLGRIASRKNCYQPRVLVPLAAALPGKRRASWPQLIFSLH